MAAGVRDDDMALTDALVKVARDHSLTLPIVKRVSEAYNIIRTLANHQMHTG